MFSANWRLEAEVPPRRDRAHLPVPMLPASPRSPTPCAASRRHGGTCTEARGGEADEVRQWVGRGETENFAEPGARKGLLKIISISGHHEAHFPLVDSPRGRHARYGPDGSGLLRHGQHALRIAHRGRTAFRARISRAEHGHRPDPSGHSTHAGARHDDFCLRGRSARPGPAQATSARTDRRGSRPGHAGEPAGTETTEGPVDSGERRRHWPSRLARSGRSRLFCDRADDTPLEAGRGEPRP